MIYAAKNVGVSRFVPCDFATPGAKGVRHIHDTVRIYYQYMRTITFLTSLPIPYRD